MQRNFIFFGTIIITAIIVGFVILQYASLSKANSVFNTNIQANGLWLNPDNSNVAGVEKITTYSAITHFNIDNDDDGKLTITIPDTDTTTKQIALPKAAVASGVYEYIDGQKQLLDKIDSYNLEQTSRAASAVSVDLVSNDLNSDKVDFIKRLVFTVNTSKE